nr:type II toxin-antitoxin system RelE/ParE family toxin [Rhodovibrio sodomensis]
MWFHPAVSEDLDAILRWLVDHAGYETAARRLAEIDEVIASLQDLPHKGSIRDEIAPGLRAIPAGRKAVIAFTVDDDTQEVFIHVVSYASADWIAHKRARRR